MSPASRRGGTVASVNVLCHHRSSPAVEPGQHRLDVDHGRAVDRFDRSDDQAVFLDAEQLDLVEPDGVRPIRRPGGEDTRRGRRRSSRGYTDRVSDRRGAAT